MSFLAKHIFKLGFIATISWIVGFFLLSGITIAGILDGRFDSFYKLDLNAKGDFLAGLFAPVAFLWLIIGSFQQQQEIAMQRDELRLQREEMKQMVEAQKAQADAVQANTNHAAMQTFLMLEKSLLEGLRWNLRKFFINVEHRHFDSRFDYSEINYKMMTEAAYKGELFGLMSCIKELVSLNLSEDMIRKLMANQYNGGNTAMADQWNKRNKYFYHMYKNKEEVTESINSYFSTFEQLICAAKEIADLTHDNRIVDLRKNSQAGELYYLFKQIIDEVEKHNAAQVAQENNPS
jgi:hypothetical protein